VYYHTLVMLGQFWMCFESFFDHMTTSSSPVSNSN